jgi:hypothetical protein
MLTYQRHARSRRVACDPQEDRRFDPFLAALTIGG